MQHRCELIAGTSAQDCHTLYYKLSGALPGPGYAFLRCPHIEKARRVTLHWRYDSTERAWASQSLDPVERHPHPTLIHFRGPVSTFGLSVQTTSTAIAPILVEISPVSRARALLSLSLAAYRRARGTGLSPLGVVRRKLKYVKLTGHGNVAARLDEHHRRHASQRASYAEWLEAHEHPFAVLDDQARLAGFAAPPRVTVICDARNASEARTQQTVDALEAQIYDNWSVLILTVGARTAGDGRVRYLDCGSPADDPAQPLRECEGEWILTCPAGARFPASALLELVHAVLREPERSVWYADSDELADGVRRKPWFKPDWNRELFYSYNYVGPVLLMKRELSVRRLDGDAPDTWPNADSVLLGMIETREEHRIGHVAKVLVNLPHESTASRCLRDPRRLAQHFAARGIAATVEHTTGRSSRVRYALPSDVPDVTLVIPTRDQYPVLRECVSSILEKTRYERYTICIVDNASVEPSTHEYLRSIDEHPRVRILPDHRPFNFSAINNHAVAQTQSNLIAFLNNDVEVISPDWLREMVSFAIQPDVGCVGAKLLYGNDQIQHAGVLCGVGNVAAHAHRYFDRDAPGYFDRLQVAQEYSAVTAACMVVRREVFDQVGGFDEQHLEVAYNDVDLCLRVRRAGYRNIYTPHAVLYHHESLTRGREDTESKRRRYAAERAYMWRTWGEELRNDPHYNPNLTRRREDFSLEHRR